MRWAAQHSKRYLLDSWWGVGCCRARIDTHAHVCMAVQHTLVRMNMRARPGHTNMYAQAQLPAAQLTCMKPVEAQARGGRRNMAGAAPSGAPPALRGAAATPSACSLRAHPAQGICTGGGGAQGAYGARRCLCTRTARRAGRAQERAVYAGGHHCGACAPEAAWQGFAMHGKQSCANTASIRNGTVNNGA